jgi:site-specific DNA-cytosine methylase
MRIVGLFAGIGGLELGFRQADPNNHATLLCDFEKASQAVLTS